VLRLTVAGEGRCVVDAFEVAVAPTPSFPYSSSAFLAGALAVVSWLLGRELSRNRRRLRI